MWWCSVCSCVLRISPCSSVVCPSQCSACSGQRTQLGWVTRTPPPCHTTATVIASDWGNILLQLCQDQEQKAFNTIRACYRTNNRWVQDIHVNVKHCLVSNIFQSTKLKKIFCFQYISTHKYYSLCKSNQAKQTWLPPEASLKTPESTNLCLQSALGKMKPNMRR